AFYPALLMRDLISSGVFERHPRPHWPIVAFDLCGPYRRTLGPPSRLRRFGLNGGRIDMLREGAMADRLSEPVESLSSWCRVAASAPRAAGLAVLILLRAKAYQTARPIRGKFVDPAGAVVFIADDVVAGQQVFLKHGLMDNGTIWGHGGYLGPDFSAQSLHILALDLADRIARERLRRGYTDLTLEEKAAIDGAVALDLKANRYDPAAGTLALPAGVAESFNGLVEYWTKYFSGPERNGGL